MKIKKSILALLMSVSLASATTTLNLLVDGADTGVQAGNIGGTFRAVQIPDGSTGTGVIDSFLRVQAKEIDGKTKGKDAVPLTEPYEHGFNTSAGTPLNDKAGIFTRSLLLTEVPIVDVGGTLYRQFLLDINQTGSDPRISLTQLQLFQQKGDFSQVKGDIDPTQFSVAQVVGGTSVMTNNYAGSVEIFRMSSGAADAFFTIEMDFSLNSGSGFGDIYFYVNADAFITDGSRPNLVLYSRFGQPGPHGTNDGFEEWAVVKANESECSTPGACTPQTVPETSSLFLFGTAALGILIPLRKRLAARKSA